MSTSLSSIWSQLKLENRIKFYFQILKKFPQGPRKSIKLQAVEQAQHKFRIESSVYLADSIVFLANFVNVRLRPPWICLVTFHDIAPSQKKKH